MNNESPPTPGTATTRRDGSPTGHAALIINPIAGNGLSARREPKVVEALKEAGLNFTIFRTEAPGHAIELARHAVSQGAVMVIAGGGDGTAHEVATGMWDSEAVLGVIPLGSGNDFAGSQGIPMDLDGAVAVLREGRIRLSDIGQFDERFFFNTLGIGFGVTVTINSQSFKRLRGHLLYLMTVLKSLAGYHSLPLVLEAPGFQRDELTYLLTVGIGTREGGGFMITPEALLDDGLFDVCIVDDISIPTALRVLPKATKGTHTNLPIVTMLKVPSLTISAREPIVVHADGQIYDTGKKKLECTCRPQSLRVQSPSS